MKFVIHGRLDGLNALISANRSGWQAGASQKKKNQKKVVEAIFLQAPDAIFDRQVTLKIKWYEKDGRRDPDNVFSAVKYILDGMVEFGTIPNDNQKYVKGISNELFIDKNDPRIEVEVLENGEVFDE